MKLEILSIIILMAVVGTKSEIFNIRTLYKIMSYCERNIYPLAFKESGYSTFPYELDFYERLEAAIIVTKALPNFPVENIRFHLGTYKVERDRSKTYLYQVKITIL